MPLTLEYLLTAIAWLLAGLVPLIGVSLLLGWLINMPLRRAENARFFLDLLNVGMRSGRTPEESIVSLSRTGDRDLGGRFHLVAAFLQSGATLIQAIERAPRLLPPQIVALLKIGEELGDFSRIMPTAQAMLKDGDSGVRKSKDYLIILAFVVTPASVMMMMFTSLHVLPKYEGIFADLFGDVAYQSSILLLFVRLQWIWIASQLALLLIIWTGVLLYFINPRSSSWEGTRLAEFCAAIHFRISWKRKRMQRDFSAALGLLLDAGVPEKNALPLAGDCSANLKFIRIVRQCAERLARGARLGDAIKPLDPTGQFQWRLENAEAGGADFQRALESWREELDTKAFQQEHAFTQAFSSGLVLWNGLIVGSLAFAVFDFLSKSITSPVLW
ncbi:MAG: type II secretory pathway component PulF [Limisphaerales bacterium]